MAHLTEPTKYNIQDSNIALLGSDLEKRVRERAGDKDPAWATAGLKEGVQVWRIEKFKVHSWPDQQKGRFYDGDSYIVLHTYKKDKNSATLSYHLHFWLGDQTSQDEAGTAAYKTVELDDHLHEAPVQYREVQGSESPQFLSYFPQFTCLKGGVATGFHHVSQVPPPSVIKLYHVTNPPHSKQIIVREVAPLASSLRYGDVFVLDKGTECLQFNMRDSSGKERFRAADFVRGVADSRAKCAVHVYEEGSGGAGAFLAAIGATAETLPRAPAPLARSASQLHRLSDAEGAVTFTQVPLAQASLASSDVFVLQADAPPAVYVWIGKDASDNERKIAVHLGQKFLHQKEGAEKATSVMRVVEGAEPASFTAALKG